jgi:hypothetical protein
MNKKINLVTLSEAASYLGYRNVNSILKLIQNGFITSYSAPNSSIKMVCLIEISSLAVPD